MNHTYPYTFIAYKKSNEIYSRNCLMNSFGSGFFAESNLSKQELIRHWLSYLKINKGLSPGECGYQFIVYYCGIRTYDEVEGIGITGCQDRNPFEYCSPPNEDEYETFENISVANAERIQDQLREIWETIKKESVMT